jgi:hypothetical protein
VRGVEHPTVTGRPISARARTPDGIELTVRWLPRHGRWEVRSGFGPDWYESRRLSLAIAAATNYRYPLDAPWIDELEREIGEAAQPHSGGP